MTSAMLVLDLKTVPDPAAGKRLLALEPFSDAEAVLAMTTLRVARQQQAMQPTHLRRVAAAVLLLATPERFELVEFDDADGEPALLTALEQEIGRAAAEIGRAATEVGRLAAEPPPAAAPVWAWDAAQHYRTQLLARALASGLPLPALLAERGPRSLAAYFGFAAGCASLAELAAVHRLPHDLGLRAADAEAAHAAGDRERLRAGSAADALMAWLLALALQVATGERSLEAVAADRQRVRDWLVVQNAPHWRAFLARWAPDADPARR